MKYMVAKEASGQNMRADMKTELHYYAKVVFTFSELGKEAVIRKFQTTAKGSFFGGGGVLDVSI